MSLVAVAVSRSLHYRHAAEYLGSKRVTILVSANRIYKWLSLWLIWSVASDKVYGYRRRAPQAARLREP